MRTSVIRPRAILTSLLAVSTVSACSTWHTQPLTPAQVIAEQHPPAVRVDRADGNRQVIVEPRVIADSLVGTSGGRRLSVPLADIGAIAVSRGDPLKSVGMFLGVVAAIGAAVIAILAIATPTR